MIRQTTKYGAKKTSVDNILFDSKAEAEYYIGLKMLQKSGKVKYFELQPEYVLLDPYPDPATGKMIRAIKYRADFLVRYPDGREEVVDVKGVRTETYKLKKKLFESRYGIPIKEVSA